MANSELPIPVNVLQATGHIASLVNSGKSDSDILQSLKGLTIPDYRAKELLEDFRAGRQLDKRDRWMNNFRYALMWLFLAGLVGYISMALGYGVEFFVPIILILAFGLTAWRLVTTKEADF